MRKGMRIFLVAMLAVLALAAYAGSEFAGQFLALGAVVTIFLIVLALSCPLFVFFLILHFVEKNREKELKKEMRERGIDENTIFMAKHFSRTFP